MLDLKSMQTKNALKVGDGAQNELIIGDTQQLNPVGGSGGYVFTIISGGGTIDPETGVFTAPTTPGVTQIEIKDSSGNSIVFEVVVQPSLSFALNAPTIAENNVFDFEASGGVAPLTYSLVAGGGTIDSSTGLYSPNGYVGSAIVKVTDAVGHILINTITINPALKISPTAKTLWTMTTQSFVGVDGVPPYTYIVLTGVGTVGLSDGLYQAPATAGTATLMVADSLGNTASASITVNQGVNLSPGSATLAPGNQATFTASGGPEPYTFSIVSGPGVISSSTATTATVTANAQGIIVLRVTDNVNNTSNANITVNQSLQINPATKTLAVNNGFTFSATGGVGTYVYSALNGVIDSATGIYTAPSSSGSDTVMVTDSLGNASSATVTINGALAISPVSKTLAVNNVTTFTASGGVGPYSYSTTIGTINSSSGSYTAPSSSGAATVTVEDSLGNTSQATVTINPALTVSANLTTIAANNTATVTGADGVSPYVYSLVSGPGSVNSSTGVYTPTANGTGVLKVTDALGNTATVNVLVNSSLQISPASKTLAVGNSFTFTASGGVFPYTFTANSGSIDASTGAYTAPASSGSATVTVTDALGNTSSSTVTINPALQITPSSKTLAANNVFVFSASNGVSPYTYSVNNGSINASTGSYTAPASSGSATVTVTDSMGNTSSSTVTINAALSLSADRTVIAANNTATVTASGGVPPYTYSKDSGPGSVNASTGVYTPGASGTGVLRVTDSLANSTTVTITVNAALAISPTSATVNINTTKTFSASGGVTPYTYSVVSGSGSVNSSSGLYSAPGTTGSVSVRVTDALGNVSDSVVTLVDCVPGSQVFTYTGAAQTFTQPAGCTKVTIKAWGAGGGGGYFTMGSPYGDGGGGGGYATGEFSLASGDTLGVYVGGVGVSGVSGGYNGGGKGGKVDGNWWGGSGGGASDIRYGGSTLAYRILVAGGGGGGGHLEATTKGGGGGGLIGGVYLMNGVTTATGGTQSSGGTGELPIGNAGTLGIGGSTPTSDGIQFSGGGGGGYYGGGSGAYYGAGGGSSYVGGVTGGSTTAASGSTPGNSADADRSGAGNGGALGAAGTAGRIVIYYGF